MKPAFNTESLQRCTESIRRFIDDRLRAPFVRAVDRLLDALPQRLDRRFALLTGGASLLTVLVVSATAALLIGHADAERRAAIGRALTAQLAALSVEPLIAGDRILLGVLASRMAELDAVTNAAVFTIDDRVLAEAGEPARAGAPSFSLPIVLEGDLAGYAQVSLDEQAFGTSAADVAAWIIAALAIVALSTMSGHGLGRRIMRRREQQLRAQAEAAANDAHAREPRARFFLVINLFNQLSFRSADRNAVITACANRLSTIARLYDGRCAPLAGTGLVMHFDESPVVPTPDSLEANRVAKSTSQRGRSFDAICAALLAVDVVGELVAARPVTGTTLDFRFALHVLELPADPHIESEAVNDTVLLSAVAPAREIAVSHNLFARLEQKERFGTRTQDNAVLQALSTAEKGSCVLVCGADDGLRCELDGQVDKLLAAVPSTSSPSAF